MGRVAKSHCKGMCSQIWKNCLWLSAWGPGRERGVRFPLSQSSLRVRQALCPWYLAWDFFSDPVLLPSFSRVESFSIFPSHSHLESSLLCWQEQAGKSFLQQLKAFVSSWKRSKMVLGVYSRASHFPNPGLNNSEGFLLLPIFLEITDGGPASGCAALRDSM